MYKWIEFKTKQNKSKPPLIQPLAVSGPRKHSKPRSKIIDTEVRK